MKEFTQCIAIRSIKLYGDVEHVGAIFKRPELYLIHYSVAYAVSTADLTVEYRVEQSSYHELEV